MLGLLAWIYLASLILFFGAEFTRVYAERFGSLANSKSAPDERNRPAPASYSSAREGGVQRKQHG
jgi:uncharacterized BrkB/YihY/UPF0761 family membrane protein